MSPLDPMVEVQFLFYLGPVILGIQLTFYFFYQYYRFRDLNLRLNRILLAYGLFTLLIVLGALFIQIARNFIVDPNMELQISRIGWGLAFSSPIGISVFMIFTKELKKIINPKIVIILLILNISSIIIVFLAPSQRSPIFYVGIGFVILNGLNVFRFQILLIKRSVGKIKKKFVQFLIGMIIALISIFFAIMVGLGVLPPGINEIVYFIGVAFLFSGLLILFISAYDFPEFYELEWRDNLSKLFILSNNECLYYSDLSKFIKNINTFDNRYDTSKLNSHDKLFSNSLVGIEKVISTITGSKKDKINKIRQEDSYILLEYGKNQELIYALFVKKDLGSIQHLLSSIKDRFESFYGEILQNLENLKGNKELLFGSFDSILYKVLKQQT